VVIIDNEIRMSIEYVRAKSAFSAQNRGCVSPDNWHSPAYNLASLSGEQRGGLRRSTADQLDHHDSGSKSLQVPRRIAEERVRYAGVHRTDLGLN